MNQLKFLIIAIPGLVGSFMVIDFVQYLYKSFNPNAKPGQQAHALVVEAVDLCQRLMDAERQAFQSYLKSPDVNTLNAWKERTVQLRELYAKADLRYKRRIQKFA